MSTKFACILPPEVLDMKGVVKIQPDIAQLVERLTVEASVGIKWSLVRFRVSGFFCMSHLLRRSFYKMPLGRLNPAEALLV